MSTTTALSQTPTIDMPLLMLYDGKIEQMGRF